MKRPPSDRPDRPERIEAWIREAQAGSKEAMGQLLEACRPYLLHIAAEELRPILRSKVGASDLVQESFLEAQRDFPAFTGETEPALLAWLRSILRNNIRNLVRFYETDKRNVEREVSLERNL